MSETIETIRRKIDRAGMLRSVVRTMKTLAASSIRQYEDAVCSLEDYFNTVELGLSAFLAQEQRKNAGPGGGSMITIAIVFGSDQGLVGQFNDTLSDYVAAQFGKSYEKLQIIAVGERINARLSDAVTKPQRLFPVPNSVNAITGLVGSLLGETEKIRERNPDIEVKLFYNSPLSGEHYQSTAKRILPVDEAWKQGIRRTAWPTKAVPQLIGDPLALEWALLREYLFVSIFRACAESLASENSSRLAAMQRAEKKH